MEPMKGHLDDIGEREIAHYRHPNSVLTRCTSECVRVDLHVPVADTGIDHSRIINQVEGGLILQ